MLAISYEQINRVFQKQHALPPSMRVYDFIFNIVHDY